MTGDIRAVDVMIHGRVQGVGYRVWTRAEADRLGLAGHVRNRADGAVAATFAGPPEAVAAMLDACRSGPPGARVTDMVVTERDGPALPPGFAILQD